MPCWLRARFAGDPAASARALALYDATGDVAGVLPEEDMDGGYRGMLHLVPALPIGADRVHLDRVARALAAHDAFFEELAARAPGKHVDYRHRALALRFFRSVKARTPSAFATGWTVAYNLAGSLNGTDDGVRETLFHEIFHLNDQAHGDWALAKLGAIHAAIVARCGQRTACLAPYAPNTTKVRGGTYYAFHGGNDAREYAAELAVRYYREELAALGHGPAVTPRFACGPAENARAWKLLVDTFFGGIDLGAPCS